MSKEICLMKNRVSKKLMTLGEDSAVPLPSLPKGDSVIMLRRRQVPAVTPLPEGQTGPQMGSFGVLVVLMDNICSQRSLEAVSKLAPEWLGREVVFLSAANARVGKQAATIFPKLFYNASEPLALNSLWKLLPWRVVVVVKAGKICCWAPRSASNVQPLNMTK
jgi:hypothetical protein